MRRECVPMIAVCVATRSDFRALYGCVESGLGLSVAVGGCGGRCRGLWGEPVRAGNVLSSPQLDFHGWWRLVMCILFLPWLRLPLSFASGTSGPLPHSRQRNLTAVPRSNERAMSKRYDPGQVTHPLDVAQSAALFGGASGTCAHAGFVHIFGVMSLNWSL